MSNCLVTGGAGFIGSHLVEGLVAKGHKVRVLDNLSTGRRQNIAHLQGKIEAVYMPLIMADLVGACDGMDYVFHLAARPSVPLSVKDPEATQNAGEVPTLKLLRLAAKAGVKRFIFAGSSSAYGGQTFCLTAEPFGAYMEKALRPEPSSPYAASKLACEHYAMAFAKCFDMDAVSLRYFNVFGPRQRADSPYSGVISIFMDKMRKGEVPHIHGDGEQTRDFTYVENVVQANILAMENPGPFQGMPINVGCGRAISLNHVVRTLNDLLKTDIKPTYGPDREGDVRDSLADIRLARGMIGYEPTVAFEQGLKRLLESV